MATSYIDQAPASQNKIISIGHTAVADALPSFLNSVCSWLLWQSRVYLHLSSTLARNIDIKESQRSPGLTTERPFHTLAACATTRIISATSRITTCLLFPSPSPR